MAIHLWIVFYQLDVSIQWTEFQELLLLRKKPLILNWVKNGGFIHLACRKLISGSMHGIFYLHLPYKSTNGREKMPYMDHISMYTLAIQYFELMIETS